MTAKDLRVLHMSKEVTTELPLASGYCPESNPLMAQYLLTAQGFDFPELNNANACQLCVGYGSSIVINAAASNTNWYGNEADTCMFLAAENLGKETNIPVSIALADFDKYANEHNLPPFDYVTLNGVWSWVSDEEREQIFKFLKNHLKPGGICQLSYLAAPGHTNMGPIVEMLHRFITEILPLNMTPDEKVKEAAELIVDIGKADPTVLIRVPDLLQRLADAAAGKDNGEFAKTYLSRDWQCFQVNQLARSFEEIGFGFVSSCLPGDQLVYTQLTDEQAEYIEQFRGTALYESCRDFIINRKFRSDIFANGARQLTARQYVEKYNSLSVMLTADLTDFDFKIASPVGETELDRAVYEPILAAFNDYEPHTIGEVRVAMKQYNPNVEDAQIDLAINTLVCIGLLVPTNNVADINEEMVSKCNQFNALILADSSLNIRTLASPVLGGGYTLNNSEFKMLQLFAENNEIQPLNMIEKLLEAVIAGELKLEGVDTVNEDELIKHLQTIVTKFLNYTLPLLNKIGII